jgi:hypothetical protein
METTSNSGQNGHSGAVSQIPQSAMPQSAMMNGAVNDDGPARQQDLADAAREHRAERRSRRLLIRADFLTRGRVRHPDGGRRPAVEILADEAAQRAEIEDETRRGSRRHHRLPPWLRRVPKLVFLFDFFLLLYFFAGITDVNWSSPLSASLVFAVLIAAMITVLSYGFLSFTGQRMRSHKDHSGAVRLDHLDGLSKAASCAAVVVVAILAGLMFSRMRTEVFYALGPGSNDTAIMIALALAAVSAAANLLVVGIHAFDGSDQVDRLNKLSAAMHRSLRKAHRLREQAARDACR